VHANFAVFPNSTVHVYRIREHKPYINVKLLFPRAIITALRAFTSDNAENIRGGINQDFKKWLYEIHGGYIIEFHECSLSALL